ncbi:ChbG/HpnK family deacetylase [Ramlibacter sp.]|uniref:ChbG/HpnK family deacetylase n=1 Tax=Ramlibacter sp. TaxID=1917967 RepID=UPI002631F744|nr:ChbG/HpnK family deacetylase [Ramlibacter sp.]MDB5954724.1 YdjC family protein [Ramlibacter sp.]
MLAPRLTLCVDDFGLHAGIHQAAEVLAGLGRIGAVSCMVAAPCWPAAAEAAAEFATSHVGVGLHLDLTEHTVDPRCRAPLAEWMARSALGRIDSLRLRGEIEAQLDRFEHSVGREPTHVDGHQHVHQLPGVREVLLSVLAGRYLSLPWVRSTRVPAAAGAKARVIQALGERGLRELCETTGLAQNGHLLGVYGFHGGADRYLALLTGWLRCARDGDLLMCHPSMASDGVALAAARRCEFDVLAGPAFAALVRLSGVQLAPFVAQPKERS